MKSLSKIILSKKIIIIASIIFLAIRIIFSLIFIQDFNSYEDYRIASNIIAGNGYCLVPQWGSTAIKSPAYPLFLSLFILLFGSFAKTAIVITQQIIFSSIPFLLIILAKQWGKFKNNNDFWNKTGYLAAWLFILHPTYFYYPNVIEVTNLFIPLLITYIIFLLKSLNTQSNTNTNNHQLSYFILTSLLCGILWLTQPIIIPLLLLVLIYLLKKKLIKFSTIYITITLITISPWAIRNYIEFNQIIITKSPFWMNLYLGWLPENHQQKKFDIIPNNVKNHINSKLENGANDLQTEKIFKKQFIKYTSKHPLLYAEKTIYQLLCYWYMPPKYWNDTRLTYIYGRKLPVIILNILLIPAIILLYRYDKNTTLIIVLILLYFSIIYGLTNSSNIRFKLDIEWLELIPIATLFIKKNKTKK